MISSLTPAELCAWALREIVRGACDPAGLPAVLAHPSGERALVTGAQVLGDGWDGALGLKLLAPDGGLLNRSFPPGLVRFSPWPRDWEPLRGRGWRLAAMPLWLAGEKGIA